MNDVYEWFENKKFNCPICDVNKEIRLTSRVGKDPKPYIVCDPCGVQLFVRKEKGIRKLNEKVNSWW